MSSNNLKVANFLTEARDNLSSSISSIEKIEKNKLKMVFGHVKELAEVYNQIKDLKIRIDDLVLYYESVPDDD